MIQRDWIVLYDDALTLKFKKMALNSSQSVINAIFENVKLRPPDNTIMPGLSNNKSFITM